MKIIFVLIYVLNLNTLVWGEDWSAIYNAGSARELLRSDQELQNNDQNKKGCHFERQQRLFPRHCLQHIKDLIGDPLAFEKVKGLKVEVNKLCIIRSESLVSENELVEILKHPFIGGLCKEKLNVRLADIRYVKR